MEPFKNEPTIGRFDSLKKVTPLSKYLAMILFIAMPFIGGWIGYKYAPAEIVQIERIVKVPDTDSSQESNFFNSVNLCGREFKVNDVYLDGIDLTNKLDQLLRSPLQSQTQEVTKSSCEEFLTNVSGNTFLKVKVEKTNYGFSEIVSEDQFNAYSVGFVLNKEDSTIDVGFFIDKESYDVFRIVVLDGSQGLKVGSLD